MSQPDRALGSPQIDLRPLPVPGAITVAMAKVCPGWLRAGSPGRLAREDLAHALGLAESSSWTLTSPLISPEGGTILVSILQGKE